jgi:14-3-3 protein epsilon
MANRNKGVYFAKFAEQAERCAEMPDHMEAVGKMGDELSVAERNRLSVAQKNADGSRRVAWRIITSVEKKKETSKGTEEQANFAKEPWTLALSPKQPRASRRSSTKR